MAEPYRPMIDVTGGALLRWAAMLERASIGWSAGAGLLGLLAGLNAHSLALRVFGCASLMQACACAVALSRIRLESDAARHADAERVDAQETTGAAWLGTGWLLLAAYIGFAVAAAMRSPRIPDPRLWGLALAGLGITVPSLLWQWKWDAARALASEPLQGHALTALSAVWMSALLAAGLVGDRLGVWWADALASSGMGVLVLVEAWDAGRRAVPRIH